MVARCASSRGILKSTPVHPIWSDSLLTRRLVPDHRASHGNAMERTYENAVRAIESRQRRARPGSYKPNAQQLKQTLASSGTPDLRGTPGIEGMSEWLAMLGYSDDHINSLGVVHVAGTKGKGSTCAFIESFLRVHGERTGYPGKTGLYTSPHLIEPEERIRINSVPLSPALFARYFWEVYDSLPQLRADFDPSKPVGERGPRSLQLYALLAFHVFIREKVDVAIFETHSGGEYDATNVVDQPVVTAITSLGMDHVQMLGPTIENIAWHKAGIYKRRAVALSTAQESRPAEVLVERAREKNNTLRFVDEDPRLAMDALQLKPTVQRKNASLAVAAAEAFLEQNAPAGAQDLNQQDLDLGVERWMWPGRFQIIAKHRVTWFLDAAHNEMSVKVAARWFVESGDELNSSADRILIYTHISEHRDAVALLQTLAQALKSCCAGVSHVIFTSYDTPDGEKASKAAEESTKFQDTWKAIFPDTRVWEELAITEAIHRAKRLALEGPKANAQVLVTGSQHLIGPALRILQGTQGEKLSAHACEA